MNWQSFQRISFLFLRWLLLDGSKLKSYAVTVILKATEEVEPKDQLPTKPDCVVFDAMRVLNKMSTKHFTTGKDLSKEFLRRIDSISSDGWASNSCIWYLQWCSLTESQDPHITQKLATPPCDFNVNLESNIEKVSMSELLASSKTKRSITDSLIQQVIDHMTTRNKDYVIAGNHKTFLS